MIACDMYTRPSTYTRLQTTRETAICAASALARRCTRNKRFGQKTNAGFYKYEKDRRGRPKKLADEAVPGLLLEVMANGPQDVSEEEITERMMLPMIIETARCLEEGIVDTVNEADMGLIMGIGFPPFRGGALRYADQLGLDTVCAMADKYAHLGKLYHPTDRMREMAANGETYYQS